MEKEVFTPSRYQQAIFDFVEHGQGNAVIEAVPGAGKTKTLIESLRFIPEDSKVLVVAFNTDIVKELKEKISKAKIKCNIDCRTLHSLGLAILRSNIKGIDGTPRDYKYSNLIRNYITDNGDYIYQKLKKKEKKEYLNTIKTIVNFGRYFLCESLLDLKHIEEIYDIKTVGNENDIALAVMKQGREDLSSIDFTDMVWLPHVLNCKPYRFLYDWILVDEVQDLEKEERELLMRCTKMSTRMLVFGEKRQAIYAFKGSDSKSFEEFKAMDNTITLPLSITYRCSKKVVNFLHHFNSQIEARDSAPDGEVKYRCDISEIKDGDMVLCRMNAPLMDLYTQLANNGVTAYVRGKDIGKNLVKLIESTEETSLSLDLNSQGVLPKVYDMLFDMIDDIMRKDGISFEMALDNIKVTQLYDKILALQAISKGLKTQKTSKCLTNKIEELFSDEERTGVSLSTIHKAKGLEADNVYICCPSLLPAKSATLDWEIEAERNLEYVAYSRPKIKLGFLDEDMMKTYSLQKSSVIQTLLALKPKIFKLYGNESRCSAITPSIDAARLIIKSATKVHNGSRNVVSLSSGAGSKRMSMNNFIKRRKK